MDAKAATIATRNYFEETRTSKFFVFEPGPVNSESKNGQVNWIVFCEIRELFDNTTKKFKVTVNDNDGAILDVEKLE